MLRTIRVLRNQALPLAVEAAFFFAAVYGAALLVQGCLAYGQIPPPKAVIEGVELTCGLAKQVEGALHQEFAVLFERIGNATKANEDDPALFVLGHEFMALKSLEIELTKWQKHRACNDA